MIRFCLCLFVVATVATLARAQETPAQKKEEAPRDSMSNDQLRALLQKVQELQVDKHYFDALQELDKAEAQSPDNPIFLNVRGSIYTGLRDFDKAKEYFELSLKRSPEAFEPRFNLAELQYVQGKYAEAESAFSKILKEVPKLREDVRHLTQFKVVVCRLKQNHIAEAEAMAKNFTFMDDTPAYYFTKAAISFQKDDRSDAASWLGRAERIFKPQQNSAYFDTLMEAHWVNSITVPEAKQETVPAVK